MSDVAKTILSQIKTLSRTALLAWGAKEFVAGENYLQMKVKGLVHKGYVKIELDRAHDLYNITAWTIRGVKITQKADVKGVFVEDLVNTLDRIIEGREYAR